MTALGARGCRTVREAARSIIAEDTAEGRTSRQIRSNDAQFQRDVLKRKVDSERNLPKDAVVFLERGVHDSFVYHSIAGLDPQEVAGFEVLESIEENSSWHPCPTRPIRAGLKPTRCSNTWSED